MAEYASKGVAGTALGLGVAGTVALANQFLGGGLLNGIGGGWGANRCGGGAGMGAQLQYVSQLQAQVQSLQAEKSANANLVAAFNQTVANDKELRGELYAYIAPLAKSEADSQVKIAQLEAKLDCCCKEQELREKIIRGDIDKVALMANTGLTALQGTVTCMQNTLNSITKTIVPSSALCPQPMPLYNSWTAPAAGAPTNTNIANPGALTR